MPIVETSEIVQHQVEHHRHRSYAVTVRGTRVATPDVADRARSLLRKWFAACDDLELAESNEFVGVANDTSPFYRRCTDLADQLAALAVEVLGPTSLRENYNENHVLIVDNWAFVVTTSRDGQPVAFPIVRPSNVLVL